MPRKPATPASPVKVRTRHPLSRLERETIAWLADAIRDARAASGLSKADVAAGGVDDRRLRQVENNGAANLTIAKAALILSQFGYRLAVVGPDGGVNEAPPDSGG